VRRDNLRGRQLSQRHGRVGDVGDRESESRLGRLPTVDVVARNGQDAGLADRHEGLPGGILAGEVEVVQVLLPLRVESAQSLSRILLWTLTYEGLDRPLDGDGAVRVERVAVQAHKVLVERGGGGVRRAVSNLVNNRPSPAADDARFTDLCGT